MVCFLRHEKPEIKSNLDGKNQTKLFFSGVFVLTAANLIIKFTGLLFKIPMNYIMGDIGMGYYGSAYSIYTFFYMLSTAGLPVAVSILVSEKRVAGKSGHIQKIFRVASLLFIIIGTADCGILLVFARRFAEIIGSAPTVACILTIAPSLLFICISSAFRGYFQGLQQMLPVAISQLIEALCKLILGISAALYSIKNGNAVHITAAYAISGITIGSFLSMVYLIFTKTFFDPIKYPGREDKNSVPLKISVILTQFVKISLPITISSSVMSLTNMIDTVLIQRLLQAYGSVQEEATAIYGNYTSLAIPMFNLPPVLIYPIAYSIIPLLSSSRASMDMKKAKTIAEAALRFTILIGVPCAFGLTALAEPILLTLYSAPSAHSAAPLLTALAPSSLFVCLLAVTNAILQSCGKAEKPVVSMLIGSGIKIIFSIILIRTHGIVGAPISTFVCYFLAATINLFYAIKYVGVKLDFIQLLMKPLIGGICCAAAARMGYVCFRKALPSRICTLAAIVVGAIAYFLALFLLKAVSKEDLRKIYETQKS